MKKVLTVVATLFLLSFSSMAQSDTVAMVTRHVNHVMIGYTGILFQIGFQSEFKIAKRWTLMTQAAYEHTIFIKSMNMKGYQMMLEPRFYYNLEKRMRTGRSIGYNSGNYFSLRTEARYAQFEFITMMKDFGLANDDHFYAITAMPTWGMKRVYRERWGLDVSGGLGAIWLTTFEEDTVDDYSVGLWFHTTVALSYRF
ncbi:DUF3575 domain-containing protein [Reichenbachiella agariperforans]|uniref:DUF3575 domain-containing protein n=1 Tax=Reichenbachiella agariperforans TaxID=156994 RepID=UPI001C0825FA|nr:DUF3575 domain-containing protein [Reichenbachiella agariperforans]MBU2913366.1 DUF3575 domain-containing protein [Reichenbachiella agariperforans]